MLCATSEPQSSPNHSEENLFKIRYQAPLPEKNDRLVWPEIRSLVWPYSSADRHEPFTKGNCSGLLNGLLSSESESELTKLKETLNIYLVKEIVAIQASTLNEVSLW